MSGDPLPDEIVLIQLADRYKQPFEYFEKLDTAFIKKLFITIKAENDAYKKMMDDAKK